jgi:hypothetical protein
VKIGKILNRLKLGTADGPRVCGGRSAVHEKLFTRGTANDFWTQSYEADGPRVRGGRSAGHQD